MMCDVVSDSAMVPLKQFYREIVKIVQVKINKMLWCKA